MIWYYDFRDGNAVETECFAEHGLVRVVDPSENELKDLSERFGLSIGRLQAATDTEEPSMWEKDETGTYLIIDVPYVNDEGHYDTVPMMVVTCRNAVMTICEKDTGITEKFLRRYSRHIRPDNKVDTEIRLFYAVTKEYQQDLKDIDSKRKAVEKNIRTGLGSEDVALLHELENSLVYFIMSLKGCSAILELMGGDHFADMDRNTKSLFQVARVENKQSIEMATVYKEIVGNTRELLSTEINLNLNRTMQVLAVFTILLTIPMVVTGAYGMNVGLPMQDRSFAFWLIFAGTACITGALFLVLYIFEWAYKSLRRVRIFRASDFSSAIQALNACHGCRPPSRASGCSAMR